MATLPPPNVGTDLIRIHKAISRGLVVSLGHCQASGPIPEQRIGYHLYLQAFVNLLSAHHLGEEEIAFPFWQQKYPQGPYELLKKQHKKILPLLEGVKSWLYSGSSGWEVTSLMELHKTLESLHEIWRIHLPIEESHFGYQNSLKYLTSDENAELSCQWATYNQEHALPSELVIPFVLYNLPKDDRIAMMQLLPPVMTQQLIPIAWKTTWEPMLPFLLE